jgi:hypothetical protein
MREKSQRLQMLEDRGERAKWLASNHTGLMMPPGIAGRESPDQSPDERKWLIAFPCGESVF